jgi:isopentenyl-diphosphate delta-isomerase
LQKRALTKYHSAGLWSNTCCGHPRPGEEVITAANRRLKEEMGFNPDLREALTFTYRTVFNNGLIENEYDHVLFGKYDGTPSPTPTEVADWKWIDMKELKKDITQNPAAYSEWLKLCLDKVMFDYSERHCPHTEGRDSSPTGHARQPKAKGH